MKIYIWLLDRCDHSPREYFKIVCYVVMYYIIILIIYISNTLLCGIWDRHKIYSKLWGILGTHSSFFTTFKPPTLYPYISSTLLQLSTWPHTFQHFHIILVNVIISYTL